jgi:hypothetical protein
MADVDILVALLDEGVDVWRPVRASLLGGDVFLIQSASVPEDEHWQHAPGEVVRCVERMWEDGKIHPVAVDALPEVPGTVRTWIELHDSTLSNVAIDGDEINVVFAPAYLHRWEVRGDHRIGTGWTQTARMLLTAATPDETSTNDLGPLDGGHVETPQRVYANMLPVPLKVTAAVHVQLELSKGRVIQASGGGIAITLEGEPRFVESLPTELDPDRNEPA